ncbi:MAG: DUF3037 domain-containing protein [Acidobacteria bacterium]|nr:DUF3037 domain-containing protein [Acidobacteriota bacterium]
MREPSTYNYAIIRVVPKVERQEFINVGVIVSCPAQKFLEARLEVDEGRLRALDATLDRETMSAHLQAILAICAGGEQAGAIGQLSQRERFYWLTATRSTMIQTSPVHSGRCQNPLEVLEHLLDTMVRPPRPVAPLHKQKAAAASPIKNNRQPQKSKSNRRKTPSKPNSQENETS